MMCLYKKGLALLLEVEDYTASLRVAKATGT